MYRLAVRLTHLRDALSCESLQCFMKTVMAVIKLTDERMDHFINSLLSRDYSNENAASNKCPSSSQQKLPTDGIHSDTISAADSLDDTTLD